MSKGTKLLLFVLITSLILGALGNYVILGNPFPGIDKETWEAIYESYRNAPALPF